MEHARCPRAPVSWGELLDKITILELKRARIKEEGARRNIEREHGLLAALAEGVMTRPDVTPELNALRLVNTALWNIEDAIRLHEARAEFGAEFIALARAVYRRNDERAAIKRRINALLGSELIEEKSYAGAHEAD